MNMASQDEIRQQIRHRLDAQGVIAIEICGRLGAGKTTVVEDLAAAIGRVYRVGVVTPGLPTSLVPSPIAEEVGVWPVEEVSRLMPAQLLDVLTGIPLASLDYLLVEQNRDPACGAPVLLGCHARGVVLPATHGLDQIDEVPLAIRDADFVLFTQADVAHPDFEHDAARARVRQIEPEIPIFFLSHLEHSDWPKWLAYLERLRQEQRHPPRDEGPAPEIYLG
jgi:Ni2+-binding GTPase involved in maturation of urease and hydrogenase